MEQFPSCCADCGHRDVDCRHELRDELAVYFSRNPDAPCPCQ